MPLIVFIFTPITRQILPIKHEIISKKFFKKPCLLYKAHRGVKTGRIASFLMFFASA